MRSHGYLYRLAMAFLISIGLNVILVAVDFSIDPRGAVKMLGEIADDPQVGFCGTMGIITTLSF